MLLLTEKRRKGAKMKYIFDEKIGLSYNASSKARDDVAMFVQSYTDKNGEKYSVIGKNDKTKVKSRVGKVWLAMISLLQLLFTLQRDDVLFVQSSTIVLKKISLIKRIKNFKLIYFVHDLDAIRDKYDDNKAVQDLVQELNKADAIICHNESMKKELLKRKCTSLLVTLSIFDYATDSCYISDREYSDKPSVCFAGNLSASKTGFLRKIDVPSLDYTMNIYGKLEEPFKYLQYKGCFKPEDLVAKLQANYGLIWEGDELFYDIEKHPYIMFNNPHKASLYITARLPIIIWESAALATFVKENEIGILISNMMELEEKISKITECDYAKMLANIDLIRKRITSGFYTHEALKKVEAALEKSVSERKS